MAEQVVTNYALAAHDEGLPNIADGNEDWNSAGLQMLLGQAVQSGSYVRSDSELTFTNHDAANDQVDVTAGVAYIALAGETVDVQSVLGGSSPPAYDTTITAATMPAIPVVVATTQADLAVQDSTLSQVWLAYDTDGTGPGSAGSVYLRSDDTGSVTAPSHPSVELGSANPDDASADTLANRFGSPTFKDATVNGALTAEKSNIKKQPQTLRASQYADNPSAAGTDSESYQNGIQAAYNDSDPGDCILVDGIFELDAGATFTRSIALRGLNMGDPTPDAGLDSGPSKSLIRPSSSMSTGADMLTFNTDDGFLWGTRISDLTVAGKLPDGTDIANTGILFTKTSNTMADVVIDNCTLHGMNNGTNPRALETQSFSHSLRVRDTFFESSEVGVEFDGGQNMHIRDGCYFNGINAQGVLITSGGTTIKDRHHITVSNNTFNKDGTNSVQLDANYAATIIDNNMEDPAASGVLLRAGRDVIIKSNTINGAGDGFTKSAIEIDDNNANPAVITVGGNIIRDPADHGILAVSAVSDLVLNANQVINPTNAAYDIVTTDVTATGNNPAV